MRIVLDDQNKATGSIIILSTTTRLTVVSTSPFKMSSSIQKKNVEKKLVDTLFKETHFTKQEIEALLGHFKKVLKDNAKKLDRNTFRDILHNTFNMTDDILMDRVFRAFDKDSDSYVNQIEWVKGLSVFLRGNKEEQTLYCFDVYDLNGDGYISREEMFHMLKTSMVKQSTEEDPDEGIKDLVEITLKKMDFDHDSRLSYNDFKKATEEEPLLLEAFGPCLPDAKSRWAYLLTFSDTPEYSGCDKNKKKK